MGAILFRGRKGAANACAERTSLVMRIADQSAGRFPAACFSLPTHPERCLHESAGQIPRGPCLLELGPAAPYVHDHA